ncbi:MAG TPA: plastocyanin/azurin family copper-binding protein [Gemmatimonadaceae bacterium]|jgi:plastocyanin|nr:plastocyanin/azurin family copper-binding protein [Gemmatimonadaceae bacterium]
MRNLGRGVIVGVVLATACGGGAKNADTTATAAPPAAAPAAGASASAPAGGAATGTATFMKATGKTWEVKMVGDASGYKYDPANLTIKQGDAVKFTVVSGPPHNVSFYADSIPAGAQNQLAANMPNPMSPLTSPLFNNPGESYTVSFAGVPKGVYKFFCTPHQALGMHAQLTVQ